MDHESSKRWNQCLAMIRERLGDQHKYDVWFKDITLYNYDPDRHLLVLQVPNNYVYEYLEENYVELLESVLRTVFDANVTLRYYLPPKQPAAPAEPDFSQVVDYLRQHGCIVGSERQHVQIADAEKRLRDGLHYFLGDKAQWLSAYDQVAAWLTDNKGRGLVLVGRSGTGKTILCRQVLPVILGWQSIVQCSAVEMTAHNGKSARIDELLKARCVIIDGLGSEDVEVSHYGRHRRPFCELCEAAEQDGKLIIATTNCISPMPMPDTWTWKHLFPTSFGERYGADTFSRLRVIAQSVVIEDSDLRK